MASALKAEVDDVSYGIDVDPDTHHQRLLPHVSPIGVHEGPFDFYDAHGNLID